MDRHNLKFVKKALAELDPATKEEPVGVSRLAMTTRKEVRGEVLYNDGDFAEIQTIGAEGIARDLLFDTVQIHRSDTDDAVAEFQRRFRVGTRLHISTTIEARIDCLRPHLDNP
jgi:hypothetical protein